MRKSALPLAILIIFSLALPAYAAGPFNIHMPTVRNGIDPQAMNVIGNSQHHMIKKGEDLLDIARHYDLGWTEIGAKYRSWDPFLPPVGTNMLIPTIWIVPDSRGKQIIVNTGEMRLYYFINNGTQVYTFPIGMGVLDFKTPTGTFSVNQKKVNPDWHIPKQLQKKYEMAVMPAGPDNPMGALQTGAVLGRLRDPRLQPAVGRGPPGEPWLHPPLSGRYQEAVSHGAHGH